MQKVIKAKTTLMVVMMFMASFFVCFHSISAHAQPTQASGGLSPSEALEYMKKTANLYMLDVSPEDKFNDIHLIGSVNIPFSELTARINELPYNRPVIVLCRLGRTCVKAYPLIRQLRPDISELHYISGPPPFEEYNQYIRKKKQK